MMIGMVTYVMTLDESEAPALPNVAPVPAVSQ